MSHRVIKTFNNKEEVLKIRGKLADKYGSILGSPCEKEIGHYVEVSYKHFTAPYGCTFPATIAFNFKD